MEVMIMDDNDRRYNSIVDLVNANKPKTDLVPPIRDEKEDQTYEKLKKELDELRKKNPNAKLAHVDSEWGFFDCGYDLD